MERTTQRWLVILVVSRDVLIVGAFMLSLLMERPVQVKPLMLSKVNTAGQIVFVVVVLASLAMDWNIRVFLDGGMAAVAVLTAASGGLYLLEWVRHMANGHAGGGAA